MTASRIVHFLIARKTARLSPRHGRGDGRGRLPLRLHLRDRKSELRRGVRVDHVLGNARAVGGSSWSDHAADSAFRHNAREYFPLLLRASAAVSPPAAPPSRCRITQSTASFRFTLTVLPSAMLVEMLGSGVKIASAEQSRCTTRPGSTVACSRRRRRGRSSSGIGKSDAFTKNSTFAALESLDHRIGQRRPNLLRDRIVGRSPRHRTTVRRRAPLVTA